MYKKLFCGALIAAIAVTGCSKPETEAEVILTPVETSTIVKTAIKNELTYAGQIKPSEKVSVASKISGKVAETFFDIGDFVSEGDVLFKLDEDDLRNQIRQLESQVNVASQGVNSAETALKSVTGGQYESQLLQQRTQIENTEKQISTADLAIENAGIGLENANIALDNAGITLDNANIAMENANLTLEKANLAIEDARTAFENAENSYNNAKILHDAGTISDNDFDKAKLAYDQSKSGMDQAQLAQEQAKLVLDQARLGLEQAQLAKEQAQLTQNQAEVAYSQAGVQREQALAGLRSAQDAYGLMQGQIISDSVDQARTGVSSAQASRQSVQVQLDIARDSLKDTSVRSPMTGTINTKNITAGEFVSPQAAAYTIVKADTVSVEVRVSEILINTLSVGDRVEVYINTVGPEPFVGIISAISPAADNTSTFPIKIDIENTGGLIKPGMFAEVRFTREKNESAIVLPRNTVLEDENNEFVYVNRDGVAKKVIVTTGIDNGKDIEILSGLTDSDEVITKGQSYVVDGEKINVVATNTGAGEAKE